MPLRDLEGHQQHLVNVQDHYGHNSKLPLYPSQIQAVDFLNSHPVLARLWQT